jgi:hypothetical protein
LDSQKADIEFSVPFDHFKHRFLELTKVAFWACKKADNPISGCVETMKHRFIDYTQVNFEEDRRQEMISQGFSNT